MVINFSIDVADNIQNNNMLQAVIVSVAIQSGLHVLANGAPEAKKTIDLKALLTPSVVKDMISSALMNKTDSPLVTASVNLNLKG